MIQRDSEGLVILDTSLGDVNDIKLIQYRDSIDYEGKSNICGVGNTLFAIGKASSEFAY